MFLIHTHKDAAQIAQLAQVLRQGCPDAVILISHDVRSTPLDPALFASSGAHLIRGAGGRGDFTILDGYLAALRWLRDEGVAYDWITNLSGQDFPIASLAAFQDLLATTEADGYLHHFDAIEQDPASMKPWVWPPHRGRDRYHYQYRTLKTSLSMAERALLRLPRVVLERLTDRVRVNTSFGLMIGALARPGPFNANFRCYVGSYWHTIRSACARYILDYAEQNPDIVRYFRSVLIPDESFFQTVLVNSRRFNLVNDNLRYVDFRGSRHGHPKSLDLDDLPVLVGSSSYFARKFDWPQSVPVLDALKPRALG
ncbi:beta-1,6-N-acetylglucosaminyltransferase [Alsobacter sp. KACC 23698]|uniref:Peptide O-xylosyltransferase n=1 Tax=Alsobacter sp. KACC 23698 TaxID=3149229 RepID=A0AAU7JIY8_9HYPH